MSLFFHSVLKVKLSQKMRENEFTVQLQVGIYFSSTIQLGTCVFNNKSGFTFILEYGGIHSR